ncbi:MAG: MFS transporter [Haloarculaceae archaeon]
MARIEQSQSALVVALIAGSHFVNHAYFMLLPPLYAPLQTELGLSDPQLGVALGTLGFVITGLQLPFGHLSDSRSRTLVLAISLSFGALGAVLTATAQNYPWLLAAQVVLGVGIAGHHPAHYPMISAATGPGQRGRAYSVHGFTGALGFAAPPAVVGIAATLGIDWRLAVLAIAAVGAVYGAACLFAVARYVDRSVTHPDPDDRPTVEDESLTVRLLAGLRSTLGSPAIVTLTVLWFVTSMAAWGIKQYTGTLLSDGYGVAVPTANLTVSAMLIVGAVVILAGGWLTDRLSSMTVLVGGYATLVVIAALLAWQILPVVAVLGLTLFLSASVDGSRPARAALADRLSTSGNAGKNFGLLTIGISGGAAVAPPVLGVVVERAGIAAAVWAIAGIGVLAIAMTVLVLVVSDELTAPVPEPGD